MAQDTATARALAQDTATARALAHDPAATEQRRESFRAYLAAALTRTEYQQVGQVAATKPLALDAAVALADQALAAEAERFDR